MLATKGDHVPTGEAWLHEVKWDGVRILAEVSTRSTTEVAGSTTGRSAAGMPARMWSRNGNDVTLAWPEIAAGPLPGRDLLVDGEVIALNDDGLPDFRVLQDRMHVRSTTTAKRLSGTIPATYMIFDLLRLDGQDLTDQPLTRRRELLTGLGLTGTWVVPESYDDGAMLLDMTRQQGFEGIVSKRRSSRYSFDTRSPHWLKFAHRLTASYVVGGWRPQVGTKDRLAALLVGEPTKNGLMYRGRVGSGIGGKASAALAQLVKGLECAESPFDDEVPREDAKGTRWIDPVLVIDVDSHQTSRNRRLRQPSYRGFRSDLTPKDLR